MKLKRLRVVSFAGIREADAEFGPGLNVLYGPNDLGKSTLAAAIRLALLLPHGSTHSDEYVGWTGGEDPLVELTFETEEQRIWRVRKKFGRRGSSLLLESRNGQDFDEIARERKVDAKLREILRWGIPEPGGPGGSKSFPASFLATALLSTQSDVGAILRASLQGDLAGSGKEQIAAALQAVDQDPLFVAMLKDTQAQRDQAYTDKGAKKRSKGSVFQVAADRVNQARDEKERLHKIVTDSGGTEKQLMDLTEQRAWRYEGLTIATERVTTLERLAAQAAARGAAAETVRIAREEVLRIQKIGTAVEEAVLGAAELALKTTEAEQALDAALNRQREADAAMASSEEVARAEGSDPALTDTVVRQQLKLRDADADRAASEAQQRSQAAEHAQGLVDAAVRAELQFREQRTEAERLLRSANDSAEKAKAAGDELQRCELLERVAELRAAEKQVTDAQAAVDNLAAIQTRWETMSAEWGVLMRERAAITVPAPDALVPMRKLSRELSAARGALDVGLVVIVSPNRSVDLRVRKDGAAADSTSTSNPLEIEANAEVEIAIDGMATVSVRGGRREAQRKAQQLESRWRQDVSPHLTAAGAADLDELEAKVVEARELDAQLKAKDSDLASLQAHMVPLANSAGALRAASHRAEACRIALAGVPLETLDADLKALGADTSAELQRRRRNLSRDVELARTAANQAATAQILAGERAGAARSALNAAVEARDLGLAAFPKGAAAALEAARAAYAEAIADKERVAAEFERLERTIPEKRTRIDAALRGAREDVEKARTRVENGREELNTAMNARASQDGRLMELRRQRDVENLGAAEIALQAATESHAILPVPDRAVTSEEVAEAKSIAASLRIELDALEREIERAHGALQQVGGAVARERFRDASEAFELAERFERETEADAEAWKLLLEQMKEADAAQASNLGQALVPAITAGFRALTQQRYESVQLTAQLGTEGIVVAGAVRPTERISVGTREQLSALYRLALAEYLRTVIVLDDQLVQSDDARMDWFRSMLAAKARGFQIVVFTCRPGDYLAESSFVPPGSDVHADTDDGFVRSVDLERAVRRR